MRAELQRTSREIQAGAGVAPTLFRPPGGNFNSQVQAIAASLGLSTILWNVDPKDWSRPGTNTIIQRVLNATHNGAIILMHDGGGDRSQTVAALPTIITTLEQRGFQFVTIPHMIENLPPRGTGPAHISADQFSPEAAVTPGLWVVLSSFMNKKTVAILMPVEPVPTVKKQHDETNSNKAS